MNGSDAWQREQLVAAQPVAEDSPTTQEVSAVRDAQVTPGQPERSGSLPVLSLPKGGGAIRGIGEKFAANPVTGTGSMTIPLSVSPGRSGFGPELALSYDSGAGNGPFGFGWSLSLPSITRKTDKGLPQYRTSRSRTFSFCPAPRIWCRLWCSRAGSGPDVGPRTVYGAAVRDPPLPAARRRAVRAHRAVDQPGPIRRTPSGARSPGKTSRPGTAGHAGEPDRRPSRPRPHFQLADLREL